MRYTVNDFRKEFPNDEVCLEFLFKKRLSDQPCCPQCSQETEFKRIPGRRCYQCSDKDCQYQLYPTAGTIFEKTRTPLTDWFYAIYLMTSTRNGVAAKELQRQLGVTYKCAFRMGHQIRKLMKGNKPVILSGIVEVDEKYHGGSIKNKSKTKRKQFEKSGKQFLDKVPLLTMLERGGQIVTVVLDNPRPSTGDLRPLINKHVEKGTQLITDGLHAYKALKDEYNHEIVNHAQDEYVRGKLHTNTVEGFFSQIERTVFGTHIYISPKYLNSYAGECAFRYIHREKGQLMFHTILNQTSWEGLQPVQVP